MINQQEPTGKVNVIYVLACPGQGQIQIDCLGALQLLRYMCTAGACLLGPRVWAMPFALKILDYKHVS